MEAIKVQLKHPGNKNAIKMEKGKYDAIRSAMLAYLSANGKATQKELLKGVIEIIEKNKTPFAGSIPWHTEWVKLDLEANDIIRRSGGKPEEYMVVSG